MVIWQAACIGLAVILSGCATNDVTGADELRLMSEQEEIRLGKAQYPKLIQQSGGAYTADPELVDYVKRVGQSVAAVADRKLPYEFVVINASDWNAWALPGGKIGINRGLVQSMQSEAELAAVLAHEVVHAAAGHGANQNAAGALGKLGLDVLGALIDNPAARQASSQLGSLFLGGAQASFSRTDELEADRFGMEYMRRAGYDLQGAVELQQRFLKRAEAAGGGSKISLFASHPPSADRVRANQEFAAQYPGGQRKEAEYQIATKRLQITQAAYKHLEQGIQLYLDDEFQKALAQSQMALKIEAREPAFYELKAFSMLGLERYKEALDAANMAVRLNPDYYRYYNVRARAYTGLGRDADARSDYQISQDLLPNAEAGKYLGTALIDSDPTQAHELLAMAAATGDEEAQQWLDRLNIVVEPESVLTVEVHQSGSGPELWLRNQGRVDVAHILLESPESGENLRIAHVVPAGEVVKTRLPLQSLSSSLTWRIEHAQPRL